MFRPEKSKPAPKKVKREPTPEPELEETTTSAFFGTSNKPKRTEPVKNKSVETPKGTPKKTTPRVAKTATPASNGRTSGRTKKPVTSYAERDDQDEFPDDDLDDADDIFGVDVKRKHADDYTEEHESEDDLVVKLPHRGTPKAPAKQQKTIKDEDDFDPEDEDVDMKDIDAADDLAEPEEGEQAAGSSKSEAQVTGAARR
jgi:replication factor C subunit 1